MGCDAHPHIEVYKDGEWELVDEKRHYYDEIPLDENGRSDYGKLMSMQPRYMVVLGGRNYTMFSVLADVRNDGSIVPLFAGRDVPDDISEGAWRIIEDDGDLHSHTYFTVKDLMDVDWDSIGGREEMALFADDWSRLQDGGPGPDHKISADWASAPNYKLRMGHEDVAKRMRHGEVTESQMVLALMSGEPSDLVETVNKDQRIGRLKYGPFVRKTIPLSYRALVSDLVAIIPELAKLADDPSHVRVVLAFDN